jgi:hypothetical protein
VRARVGGNDFYGLLFADVEMKSRGMDASHFFLQGVKFSAIMHFRPSLCCL